jgi:transcriptional regulator with XRE-family HTH domain
VDEIATPSERLRSLRTLKGLSQRELGFFAGCSHVTISRVESGALEASAELKTRIARALGVSVEKLWAVDGAGS